MARLFTRRRLFALDGAIFLPVGLIMLALPSPEATMAAPPTPEAAGPLMDTRRLLASQFITVGLLMLVFARTADRAAVRNAVCRFRALSLAVLLGVTLMQLVSGRWKHASYGTIVGRFVVLTAIYAYLGFVRPEREE